MLSGILLLTLKNTFYLKGLKMVKNMVNKKVQKIYNLTKKVDYFSSFESSIRDGFIIAKANCNERSKALSLAMKLLAEYKDEIIVNYFNNTVVVATKVN